MYMPLPPCRTLARPLMRTNEYVDRVRGEQEGVLAHVELHAGVQRQHDQLARRVAGEGDPARAVGQR